MEPENLMSLEEGEATLKVDLGRKWLDKIERAGKREEDWMQGSEAAEKIYLACDDSVRFNILHSNVETIVPALYNSTAVPDIRARFGRGADDTPAYRASQVIEACIAMQIDDSVFDDAIERAAKSAFIAGRGVPRLKLTLNRRSGSPEVIYESVSYKDFRWGSARLWRDVPWVAFRHWLSGDQIEDVADPDTLSVLRGGVVPSYAWPECDEDDVEVWEVWDKLNGVVLFLAKDGAVLREEPDPLGLSGFFPMPEPIQPITPTDSLKAVCPYSVYKKLDCDLQDTSRRIAVLTKACRAVGIFVGNADQINQIQDVDDGQFVAVQDLEGAAAVGGLEKAISYWPVEKVIAVLRELYVSRDQIKQAIYEITGISDIVRGQTNASETATAQDIKSRWGSLRIRKLQTLIERCARDLFVLTAEIICNHFDEETLTRIYGEPIDPETLQILTSPLDHMRIDVETNSTVRNDQTLMQSEMANFLRGTAEYFSTMGPLLADPRFAPAMAPILKLYGSFARTFNLGRQADDAIEEVLQIIANSDPAAEQAQQQQQEAEQAQQAAERAYELDARKVAVQEGKLTLDERKAEIDAAATLAEIDMEAEQQRPVAFNDIGGAAG